MSLQQPSMIFDDSGKLDAAIERLERETVTRKDRNRLKQYAPYPKQLEFHRAGTTHRERLFLAANQCGKTLAGAMEMAMHLTGRYPEWWEGRVVDRPVRWWASGVTGLSCRDNPQRLLLGPPQDHSQWGTGAIPGDAITGFSRWHGIPDAVDSILVRHTTGKNSVVSFKAYEQGREKWQGETLDGVWFDEEPPMDIYTEGLTRTNATGGMTMMTATPLLGMTEVIRMFLADDAVRGMQ